MCLVSLASNPAPATSKPSPTACGPCTGKPERTLSPDPSQALGASSLMGALGKGCQGRGCGEALPPATACRARAQHPPSRDGHNTPAAQHAEVTHTQHKGAVRRRNGLIPPKSAREMGPTAKPTTNLTQAAKGPGTGPRVVLGKGDGQSRPRLGAARGRRCGNWKKAVQDQVQDPPTEAASSEVTAAQEPTPQGMVQRGRQEGQLPSGTKLCQVGAGGRLSRQGVQGGCSGTPLLSPVGLELEAGTSIRAAARQVWAAASH